VVACSDSSGYVHDPDGIDLDLLRQVKEVERARISAYAHRRPSARLVPNGSIWDVPCHIAIPCATQNELTGTDAVSLARHGCIAVAEGANMPATADAVVMLREAGIAFAPGKAANAGGVATSGLEMQQNAGREVWTFEETERRLASTMATIHRRCQETAEEYGSPGDLVAGANIAGFDRVARAMLELGLI
jgi:glutamate dehydrogenase (NADP+)